MVFIHFTWPLVFVYSKMIKEIKSEKGLNNHAGFTILALMPKRFVGDLEVLAENGEFRILAIPFDWQTKILSLYWNDRFDSTIYTHKEGSSNKMIIEVQRKLRCFMKCFLSSLYRKIGVDCVIGSGIFYRQNYDWGLVSNEIGIPYIVLHKENLINSRIHRRNYEIAKRNNRFQGAHIIVHNTILRDIFIKAGYVRPEQISSLGCLRMDGFVQRVKKQIKINNKRKKVVLFSFSYNTGLGADIKSFTENRDVGVVNLFEHVHVSIAKLAMKNKEVDFVIKAKWGGNWLREIEFVCKKNGIVTKELENLSVLHDVNVHNLIFESDVVCVYGSTTALESAIAAKPVIVPYFDEALKPEYADGVHHKDYFHLFDIAHSVEEFERLIVERLANPAVSEDCINERYAVFEKYVSSMKGNAREQYIGLIKKIVKESKWDHNL